MSSIPSLYLPEYIAQSLNMAASSSCFQSCLDWCFHGITNVPLVRSIHFTPGYIPLSTCCCTHSRSPNRLDWVGIGLYE